MDRLKHALYLAGHVDSVGNISDPIFIRYLSELPKSEDVPKNCFAVSQSFDGMYWSSCSDEIHPDYYEGWLKGDFCLVTYFDSSKKNKINEFFCEITTKITVGHDHFTGKLYSDEFKFLKEPKDICVADISDIY